MHNLTPQSKWRTGWILAALALLFTFAVSVVDRAAIGPEGTAVGFSRVNQAVHEALGVHMAWYTVTEILGYAALALAGLFALLGMVQLVRRRSLWKVDREILALGCLYAVVLAVYVLFEVVIVNYRPIVMPGDLVPEASYPSSHTMLSCTVLGSTILVLGRYFSDTGRRKSLQILCGVWMAVIVCGRLVSGVHWFTDILGAVFISAALLFLFAWGLDRAREGDGTRHRSGRGH